MTVYRGRNQIEIRKIVKPAEFTNICLTCDRSDIKGILQDQVNQINTKKPDPLPSTESTIPVHKDKGPEGVENKDHGRKVEGKKIGWKDGVKAVFAILWFRFFD